MNIHQNITLISGSVDKLVCREWVHASHKRIVKLRLGPEPALHVTDRKGDKLRTLPLDQTDQLTVIESQVSLFYLTSPVSIYLDCLDATR